MVDGTLYKDDSVLYEDHSNVNLHNSHGLSHTHKYTHMLLTKYISPITTLFYLMFNWRKTLNISLKRHPKKLFSILIKTGSAWQQVKTVISNEIHRVHL